MKTSGPYLVPPRQLSWALAVQNRRYVRVLVPIVIEQAGNNERDSPDENGEDDQQERPKLEGNTNRLRGTAGDRITVDAFQSLVENGRFETGSQPSTTDESQ